MRQIQNDEIAYETTPSRSRQGHRHPFLSLHCLPAAEGANVKTDKREGDNAKQKANSEEIKSNLTDPPREKHPKSKKRRENQRKRK